jgi:hypothetical protein
MIGEADDGPGPGRPLELVDELPASSTPNAKRQETPPPEANLELGHYVPFPLDALPEPVRGYTDACSAAIGCDPAYVALPVLSMLAGAIGNTDASC